MSRYDRLFRTIVVMGAAITAPACDSGRPKLIARKDAPAPVVVSDASAPIDAPSDAPANALPDAVVYRVMIL